MRSDRYIKITWEKTMPATYFAISTRYLRRGIILLCLPFVLIACGGGGGSGVPGVRVGGTRRAAEHGAPAFTRVTVGAFAAGAAGCALHARVRRRCQAAVRAPRAAAPTEHRAWGGVRRGRRRGRGRR